MGSKIGADKVAANKLGISYEEWLSKRRSGLKWCTFGSHWEKSIMFPPDCSRGDGLAQGCHTHLRAFHASRPRSKGQRYDRPEGDKAGHAVNHAIARGDIPRPATLHCAHCGHTGSDRRHEYHHHKGYAREHWLEVIALCSRCHRIETRREMGLPTYIPPTEERIAQ